MVPDEAPGHTAAGHGCNPSPGCEDIHGRFPGVLFSEDKYFGKKSHLLCILRDTDENLICFSISQITERRKNEKNISSFPKKMHLYNMTEALR